MINFKIDNLASFLKGVFSHDSIEQFKCWCLKLLKVFKKSIAIENISSITSTSPKQLYKEINSADYDKITSIKSTSATHESLLLWAKSHLSGQSTRLFNELLIDQNIPSLMDCLRIMRYYSELQSKKSKSTAIATKSISYLLDFAYLIYFPFFGFSSSPITGLLILLIYIFLLRSIFSFILCEDYGYFAFEIRIIPSKRILMSRFTSLLLLSIIYIILPDIALFSGLKFLFANLLLLLVFAPIQVWRSLLIIRSYGLLRLLQESNKARKSLGLIL